MRGGGDKEKRTDSRAAERSIECGEYWVIRNEGEGFSIQLVRSNDIRLKIQKVSRGRTGGGDFRFGMCNTVLMAFVDLLLNRRS